MAEPIQESTTREAVQRYIDGLNALDADLVASAYAPNAVIRYPGQPPLDVDGFRALLEQVMAGLEDFDFTTEEVFEADHGVAARWAFEATTKSGRTVTCHGIDSWVIGPDGTIESVNVCYDPSPLLAALEG